MDEADDFLMGGVTHDGPRIRHLYIDHASGTFGARGNEVFTAERSVVGVPLLVVPRRTMWPERKPDGVSSGPVCKSPNAAYGFPGPDFPWSGVMPRDYARPIKVEPSPQHPDGFDSGDHPVIICANCPFSQWTEGPTGRRVPPPCRDSYVMLLLTEEDMALPHGGVTSIEMSSGATRVAKDFVADYHRTRTPLFFHRSEIELTQHARNGKRYSSPSIGRVEDTDPSFHPIYADWARWARAELLTSFRPPRAAQSERTGFEGIL